MDVKLLPLIESITFHDIDELAERMGAYRWNMVHRQIEKGAFEGELLVAQLAGMQFARMTYDRGIRSWGDSPAGTIAIAFPLSIPRSLNWHGYSLSPNHALLQKSSQGIDFLRRGNFPLALVSIDIDSLLRVAELSDRPQIESLVLGKTRVVQPDARTLDRFRSQIRNLFALIEQQPEQLLQPAIQTGIRENFISLILDALDSHQNCPALRPSTRHPYIKQAEAMLLENLDCPLAIPDLCAELHVSERTLRYGFQECFGMAPVTYLKIQRLNGVRRQLKASAGKETTVSNVALQWGFWHMGQFAKDYKNMFGESPSKTLRHCS